jgi:hypothetical protein
MKTKAIDPKTKADFVKLYYLCMTHGIENRYKKQTQDLHPNSTIATIDFTKQPSSFGVSDTYLIGYCFVGAFPDKSLLNMETVLIHFDELVLKRNHKLLDQLYRGAFKNRTKE